MISELISKMTGVNQQKKCLEKSKWFADIERMSKEDIPAMATKLTKKGKKKKNLKMMDGSC